MGVVNNSKGALPEIAKRISSVASDITTVRTATVATDGVPPAQTQVVLDNDPSRTPINAMGLNSLLPKGTRVACLAYPPRGLLVLGVLEEPAPLASLFYAATTTPVVIPDPGFAYRNATVELEAIGGGGAGGGATTTAAGQSSVGTGGSAGMWVRSVYRASELVWPLTIQGGAAGLGTAGGNGGVGGYSEITDDDGTLILQAGPGAGGGVLTAASGVGIGLGALASFGQTWVGQQASFGGDGHDSLKIAAAGPCYSGSGGSSYHGGGGRGGRANENGFGAATVGGGGGAAQNGPSQGTARTGGSGQVGVCYVRIF